VQRAVEVERALSAPFQTLTHGDFNVDNIIFEVDDDRTRLIDLHRSSLGDYVQDVSVFLVSNFRLQIFEAPVRKRIAREIGDFHAMAAEFADRAGDRQFGARLAFGLARSFATSTRFILDEGFAHGLFLRSRFLLDRLLATPPERLPEFRIPLDILSD
jgi:aminoglycoside phosphotransferase (APT) family kinase protein